MDRESALSSRDHEHVSGLVVMVSNPVFPAVAVLILAWFAMAGMDWVRKRRRLRALTSRWGRPPEGRRTDPVVSRRLHDLMGPSSDPETSTLDDRTWADLDLDALHARMDHTLSPIGAQVLHRLLRTLRHDPRVLERRRRLLDLLEADHQLRNRLQLALVGLRDRGLGRLAETLWGDPPSPFRLKPLIPLLAIAPLVAVVAAMTGHAPWMVVVATMVINMVIHYVQHRRLEAFPLIHLGALLGAAARIETAAGEALPQTRASVRPGLIITASTRRRLSALQLEDGLGLAMYLRIVLLLDVAAWASAAAAVRRASSELRQLLVAVGEVDAMLAIASWRHGVVGPLTEPKSRSTVAGGMVDQVRHPLLDQPVPSSLEFDGRGILVTGSNMSGKTTFLKALGVNAVFAQTIGLVMAERWSLPPFAVVTSIGRADNLIEGRSYYLAEVEAVARMVRVVGDAGVHLFLADEIFRGTNAVERIGGAAAVLRYLARDGDLVLAATHDLELAEMLTEVYRPVHFAEGLDEDGLSFDYRLRPGVTTGRTALDLLEYVGYPDEVVVEARRLVAELEGLA